MSTTNSDTSMSDAHFEKLRGIIHANTGITIGEARKTMLVGRLRSRLRETEEPNFKAYLERIRTDAGEMQELINRVTTNKTYFYRTPRIWEHFRDVSVPEFRAKKLGRQMRIWSGAASTGEEAHTIGVVLEDVRAAAPEFDYSILGTDISSRVLAVAEEGIYQAAALAQFKMGAPDLVNTHMTGSEANGFRVNPQIKSKIRFKLHNLQKQLRVTGKFDVVFLRNVLIYFTPEDQTTILQNVISVMEPDGTLIIGESETITRLDLDLDLIAPTIYRPKTAGPAA